jgi:P-type Mg2+ transporter
MDNNSNNTDAYWSRSAEDNLKTLQAKTEGLTSAEAQARLQTYGFNVIAKSSDYTSLRLFLQQFKSPITLMLLGASILSFFLGDPTDAVIIFVIVGISSILGFWQEKSAGDAVKKLLSLVELTANVLRDGKFGEIPLKLIVPGDIIQLNAGDIVPADCLLVTSNELFTNEAAFTGESFPVEKKTGIIPADSAIAARSNMLFMGSNVISGTANALAVKTGLATEFGHISADLKKAEPETDFEKGIRRLGYLLMQLTTIMLVVIFFVNTLMHKPVLDSFLFALALAVGLTPQLLPAIISVNLAKGARQMAGQKVIVKRLSAIESLGSMNVLCSDKTGTLTEGVVTLYATLDAFGKPSDEVLFLAGANSSLQQGFQNPIDDAILQKAPKDVAALKRVDEIPYDFIRKRLSILTALPKGNTLIVKGALNNVLEVCANVKTADDSIESIDKYQASLQQQYKQFSDNGYRTLGVAVKEMPGVTTITSKDETGLTFVGFLTFYDPVKKDAAAIIKQLHDLGISLKVITGDNALVAGHICQTIGLDNLVVLTGGEMRNMSQEALFSRVKTTQIFAEIEPNQKERIILSLKKAGMVVGYMGDGINDANALKAADVGISVNTAVDVAKEAADLVLLDQNLSVLINGVKEGRRVFTNTIKYIFMATSANFGNMFSMAGASLLLPFLPLLPKQILLTNLLTDFPSMAIATDNIDLEDSVRPRQWDIGFIKKFMIFFGLLSSVFDYLTFAVLIHFLKAGEKEFQTGWFLESVVSATLIVLVVRTRNTFYKSRPGKYLLIATLAIVGFVLVLPVLPFASALGFVAVPPAFYLAMLVIVLLYLVSAEMFKKFFFRRFAQR